MPRPIPLEPPVTNAVFSLSVIRHLLAQNLRRMLGPHKAQVNRSGISPVTLRTRENVFQPYLYARAGFSESHLNFARVQRIDSVRYAGMEGRLTETSPGVAVPDKRQLKNKNFTNGNA